jgi:5-formyltetrahydrofolate cyclo-ligase
VTVITGMAEGDRPHGFTIGSFTSVSLDPPLVGFLPQTDSETWALMADAETVLAFTTIPGEPDTRALMVWCAATGRLAAVPEADVDPSWPDAVIVPGLAFTTAGDRLGQGGGWYDRFLSEVRADCVTIGVCFAEQLVDALPVEPHDVTMDHVVTDRGVAR